MFKKLTICYDEDHEPIDIEDQKIYWDTQKNVFRHKFTCKCGKPIDCRCYKTLHSALTGVDDGMRCYDCWLDSALSESEIPDLIYKLDNERQIRVAAQIHELITPEDAVAYFKKYPNEKLDADTLLEMINEYDKEDELREFILGLMTTEEKEEEAWNNSDGYAEGNSCEM